jgi:hypothetical protein
MKTEFKLLPMVCVLVAITGCDTETEKSVSLCTNVENKHIEAGATGFRDVIKVSTGSEDVIGYMDNGTLVPHSECSAAKIDNSTSTYSWFQFGQAIENDSVHSIHYYTNSNGELSSNTTRLEREGHWQEQYVENEIVTKQVWTQEALFSNIETVDNYGGDGIRQVVIMNGNLKKTKRFNSNTVQFDCSWDDNGTITNDAGCTAESTNDIAIFGIDVDGDFYLNELLNASITYELDQAELDEDINRYW